MAANKNATHTSPPAILRDSSAVGSNEKLKITTTRSEKNSMAFMASFDRHSRRTSLVRVARVIPKKLIAKPPAAWQCDPQSCQRPSAQIRLLRLRANRVDA